MVWWVSGLCEFQRSSEFLPVYRSDLGCEFAYRNITPFANPGFQQNNATINTTTVVGLVECRERSKVTELSRLGARLIGWGGWLLSGLTG